MCGILAGGAVQGLASGKQVGVQVSASAGEDFRASTFTNQAGEFLIQGVPAGTAEIIVALSRMKFDSYCENVIN